MTAKKQDLIAKLLAKAESTTPEEAEALTEAAEKLMVKFGIDQAMIDARRAKDSAPEEIVTETIWFKGIHSQGLVIMASQVVSAFGTMRTYSQHIRGSSHRAVVIVGFKSDVAQTKVLVESLHLQAIVAMRAWWKTFGARHWLSQSEGNRAKRQFLAAFGQGASERIEEATRKETERADTEAATAAASTASNLPMSTALVLRERGHRVQEHLDAQDLNFRKSRTLKGSRHGHAEGHRAGREANTGATALA